jgi:tripartite ATP-independent transporter DctM subunit
MKLVYTCLRKLLEGLVVAGCAVMTTVVVAAAFSRYVLNIGLFFSEDLSRYLMVVVVFLAAALVLDDKQHVKITLVTNKFAPRSQVWMNLLAQMLILVFLVIVALEGAKILPRQAKSMIATMPKVSLVWFYAAIPLGCIFMALFLLSQMIENLKTVFGKTDAALGRFAWKELLPAGGFLLGLLILIGILQQGVSRDVALLVLAIGFFLLVFLSVPVGFALGLSGIGVLMLMQSAPLRAVPTLIFGGISPFALMAIPLFILAGLLVERIGVVEDLVKFSDSFVGHLPGGQAHANIVASMLFAGVSGAALAEAAAIGSMLIPPMIKQGYDRKFSAAVTAAAATVGPIIPPSVGMIIYAYSAGGRVSIGGLFVCGAIPGVILGVGMMALTYVFAIRRNYPVNEAKFSLVTFLTRGRKALLGLIIPIIILGGIISGMFTPTEAGGIAALYGLIVGVLVTRKLGFRRIVDCLLETGKITASVFLLLGTAKIISYLLSIYQAPIRLTNALQAITDSPYLFIVLSMGVLLLLGFVMEGVAIMIMLVPVFSQVAAAYQINPYHYGLLFVMTIQLALLTPPVALSLFIVARLAKISVEEVVEDIWPFLILIFGLILIIAMFPGLTLWLPKLVGYIQ